MMMTAFITCVTIDSPFHLTYNDKWNEAILALDWRFSEGRLFHVDIMLLVLLIELIS